MSHHRHRRPRQLGRFGRSPAAAACRIGSQSPARAARRGGSTSTGQSGRRTGRRAARRDERDEQLQQDAILHLNGSYMQWIRATVSCGGGVHLQRLELAVIDLAGRDVAERWIRPGDAARSGNSGAVQCCPPRSSGYVAGLQVDRRHCHCLPLIVCPPLSDCPRLSSPWLLCIYALPSLCHLLASSALPMWGCPDAYRMQDSA